VTSLAGLALLALPAGVASGQYYGSPSPSMPQQGPSGSRNVNAEGNAFTGGLQFNPADVSVSVGEKVRWTNTDKIVPHTATEDHGLWSLEGSHYGSPGPYQGFGPGESVERTFEAGTQRYYCKVHPQQMHGVVRVPAQLKLTHKKVRIRRRAHSSRRRRHFRTRYTVAATWAAAVESGLVFDVQYRRAGRAWKTLRVGSGETGGTFRGGTKRHVTWEVRARLRAANSSSRHTDWSPVASVTT